MSKRYADLKRKPMDFQVGDKVMLKVSPWKGVIHTVMSDSEDSTVTYTAVSSPFGGLSDIGSPGVDGPPVMPEDPYAYVVAAFQDPKYSENNFSNPPNRFQPNGTIPNRSFNNHYQSFNNQSSLEGLVSNFMASQDARLSNLNPISNEKQGC
ncbi:hypothetical protein Tco_0486498 [Tanacetum coccineum]